MDVVPEVHYVHGVGASDRQHVHDVPETGHVDSVGQPRTGAAGPQQWQLGAQQPAAPHATSPTCMTQPGCPGLSLMTQQGAKQ